jgi:hypothetical protein
MSVILTTRMGTYGWVVRDDQGAVGVRERFFADVDCEAGKDGEDDEWAGEGDVLDGEEDCSCIFFREWGLYEEVSASSSMR